MKSSLTEIFERDLVARIEKEGFVREVAGDQEVMDIGSTVEFSIATEWLATCDDRR